MARENKSVYALLGILSIGPRSGYEIKKLIGQSLIHFWQEGYGQIYPNLKKLVEEDLATVHTEKQSGRPDKMVYTITEKGREELIQWLKKPIEHLPPEKNELLLKLFFGRNVSAEDNLAHVKRYRERMAETLELYNGIEAFLTSEQCDDPNIVYSLMTLRYGQRVVRAIIEWCDESISTLQTAEIK